MTGVVVEQTGGWDGSGSALPSRLERRRQQRQRRVLALIGLLVLVVALVLAIEVISVRTGHPAALFSGVFDRANTFGFAI